MIKVAIILAFIAVAQAGVIAPVVPAHAVVAHPVAAVAPVAVSHAAVIHPVPVVHAAPLVHAPVVPVVKHAPIIAVHH